MHYNAYPSHQTCHCRIWIDRWTFSISRILLAPSNTIAKIAVGGHSGWKRMRIFVHRTHSTGPWRQPWLPQGKVNRKMKHPFYNESCVDGRVVSLLQWQGQHQMLFGSLPTSGTSADADMRCFHRFLPYCLLQEILDRVAPPVTVRKRPFSTAIAFTQWNTKSIQDRHPCPVRPVHIRDWPETRGWRRPSYPPFWSVNAGRKARLQRFSSEYMLGDPTSSSLISKMFSGLLSRAGTVRKI